MNPTLTNLDHPLRARFAVLSTDARHVVQLPSLDEYRRLRDDPDIQWIFDEDGFPLGGVARSKPATPQSAE